MSYWLNIRLSRILLQNKLKAREAETNSGRYPTRRWFQTDHNILYLSSGGEPTNSGLGYSMLFLCDSWNVTGPKYVFKIIEIRSHEFIMKGIKISLELAKSTRINYVHTLDGNIAKKSGSCLAFYDPHCWRKFEIKREEDILNTVRLSAGLHQLHNKQDVRDSGWEALEMLDDIISYRNDKVQTPLTPLSS